MPDEDEIVNAAREGSAEAFTALVAAYQARVRGYLARWVRDAATVDDLAQEVFLAAYRNLRGFDGAVPIGAWFAGIARNQALTHLRSLRRKRAREADAFAAAFQMMHRILFCRAPGRKQARSKCHQHQQRCNREQQPGILRTGTVHY